MEKIYLIFSDSVDNACEIKGYIYGTAEDAQAYCEKLNHAQGEQPKGFVWMELLPLFPHQKRMKTILSPRFTTVSETAKKWGISMNSVYKYCEAGRIPGVVYADGRWYIPENAKKPMGNGPVGTLPVSKKAEKWGVTVYSIIRLCELGQIPGAVNIGCHWYVPEDAVYPLEGYIELPKMAEKWGIYRSVALRLCKEGRIPGAVNIGCHWYLPADAQKPADERTDRRPGYISASQAARNWGTSRNYVCKACREGRIPGAELIDGRWHIPEEAEKPVSPGPARTLPASKEA